MIVTNDQGMQHLLSSKFKLGADASAAAGPVGRDAAADTDVKMRAEVLTYSRARGLFAGIDLSGAALTQDKDETRLLYGTFVPFAGHPERKSSSDRGSEPFLAACAGTRSKQGIGQERLVVPYIGANMFHACRCRSGTQTGRTCRLLTRVAPRSADCRCWLLALPYSRSWRDAEWRIREPIVVPPILLFVTEVHESIQCGNPLSRICIWIGFAFLRSSHVESPEFYLPWGTRLTGPNAMSRLRYRTRSAHRPSASEACPSDLSCARRDLGSLQ